MPLEFVRASRSEAETIEIGRQLGRMLRAGDLLLLSGPLGAGKTLLVRAIAEALGLDTAAASSPTFVLVHIYRKPPNSARADAPELVHIDAYRLRGGDDFDTLGLENILGSARPARDGRRVDSRTGPSHEIGPAIVVEWAERLPSDAFAGIAPARIRIDPTGVETRELWFTLPDAWGTRPGLHELRQRQPTRCPITGRLVPADSPTWPFADEKARMADLHRWFSGAYTISRTPDSDDDQD